MCGLRLAPGSRAGALFVLLGAALTGAYYALPAGSVLESIAYEAVGVSATLVILWAIRLHRPATALPWILIAVANASSVAGNVTYELDPTATSPALYDLFYLAAYPLLAAALLILLVRAGGHHRLAAVTEAAIATCAFALVQWVFFVHPALGGPGTLGARAIAATYPVADLVLLAGFAGFFVSPAWRKPAFWLLVGGVVTMIVGDDLYAATASTYVAPSPVDATWLASSILAGIAALHPSMRELEVPRRWAPLHVSGWRIALLSVALLTPPGILVAQWARGAPLEVPAVVAAAVPISLLVVLRLTGILRMLERLRILEREARAEAEAAQQRLAEQNELLREADRLKDEVIALVSQDLRTPLTSIVGYTELALEGSPQPLDSERRAHLEVVSRSSERLLQLVDDLLFVARLQAGKGLRLEVSELDVAVLAREAVREAGSRAHAKGIDLRYSGLETAPVQGDRGRLFQLLDNVVSNALKFTPTGGTVEVAVEPYQGGIALEVCDTGIGLAPGDAERLFDRFYRSRRAVGEEIPGTGLGLFIARAIVEAHGGRISARGGESGGTTFRIELPVRTPLRIARLVA